MLNRQKNSQGFTKRKARLREDIILESKLAINFIRIQLAPELCEEINLLV